MRRMRRMMMMMRIRMVRMRRRKNEEDDEDEEEDEEDQSVNDVKAYKSEKCTADDQGPKPWRVPAVQLICHASANCFWAVRLIANCRTASKSNGELAATHQAEDPQDIAENAITCNYAHYPYKRERYAENCRNISLSSPPRDLHEAHNLARPRRGTAISDLGISPGFGHRSGLAGELQLFHDFFLVFDKGKMGKNIDESRKKGKDLQDILQTFISHAWKAHSWSSFSSCVACVLQ